MEPDLVFLVRTGFEVYTQKSVYVGWGDDCIIILCRLTGDTARYYFILTARRPVKTKSNWYLLFLIPRFIEYYIHNRYLFYIVQVYAVHTRHNPICRCYIVTSPIFIFSYTPHDLWFVINTYTYICITPMRITILFSPHTGECARSSCTQL